MNDSEGVRVTLVRHGQSESNVARRWQGQGDSPLSGRGRRQAERVGARLSGRRFDRVFSSDLHRAADTARAIRPDVETYACFREFDIGAFEGLTQEQVAARFPEQMTALAAGEDIALGGGESYSSFRRRVDAALRWACEDAGPGAQVLIVCHGGFIASVLAGALGLTDRTRWPLARVSNTSITELTWHSDGASLEVFNDDLHLMEEREPLRVERGREVGLAVAEHGEGLGHLRPWLQQAQHAYDLSVGVTLPGWLSASRGEPPAGDGPLRVRPWLAGLVERHAAEGVACVCSSMLLSRWTEDLLWGDAATAGSVRPRVSAARHGTWSRARVLDEQLVLDSYNADPRR